MIHRDTKSVAHGLSVWYDTPWIRVKPYEEKEYKIPEDEPENTSGGHLKALTADELVAHRLRGHVPNLRVRFVSRVVVFTNTGEGLGTNLARKFLRILVFLVRKGLMNLTNRASNFW